MGYRIDIDTGGTFTDAFISGDNCNEALKVDTTPHDLTVGLTNCLEQAAKRLGFRDIRGLLKQTEVIRFSSTIATNTLIQKTGSKLGLMVSKGFENTVYGNSLMKNTALGIILDKDMVIGISGRIDSLGNVEEEIKKEEIITTTRELLTRGARVIVISLLNSPLNPSLEREVKKVIETDYPRHYLGSLPIVTSTEINLSMDNACRTNAALIDGYAHRELAKFLFKAEDDLRSARYINPFLITHNWGGAARVAKTKAISTYSSGPAAGILGAAIVSKLYGISNLVTIDVGGTSTDVGVLIGGKPPVKLDSEISGMPVKLVMLETYSIGAGGGSIVNIQENQLRVGPQSAGAIPGPVCYDLGGTEPTVTDAAVALGYINPDYFLGGKRKLAAKSAYKIIEKKVAKPLGLAVEGAAFKIIKEQAASIAEFIKKILSQKALEPKNAIMLSFGGAGGISCAELAKIVGVDKIYIPPFAAVFSAFGSSSMDIAHEHEAFLSVPLELTYFDKINQAIDRLKNAAVRDLRLEGVALESIKFALELELSSKLLPFLALVSFPKLSFQNETDIEIAREGLTKAYRNATPEGYKLTLDQIVLETVKLRSYCPVGHSQLQSQPRGGETPESALKKVRKAYWDGSFRDTPVFEQKLLRNGNAIKGPAIIEGEDTTILIPKGSRYFVDDYLFGIIEEDK